MKKDSLLPDRHPNSDFFIADIFDSLPVKNDRHTMEHPFFALSTKKDTRTIKYEHNGITIKLSPSAEFGLPTMMDKDVLLYCGSQLMEAINKGIKPSKTVRFSCHDLMVTTNRHTNDVAYSQLRNAFERLAGCLVTTNIKTNTIEKTEGFHLIENYKVIKGSHEKKRMVQVEVTVSDWFYNSLLGGEVLTINRDYFRLRKTLERRLYEIARKFCGKQPQCSMGLDTLKDKCGSRSDLNKFRFQLRKIIASDLKEQHFPDYQLSISENDIVTFIRKGAKNSNPQGQLPLDDNIPAISHSTIDKARNITIEANTGWDFDVIHAEFTQALIEGFKPNNVNGAFIGFVKKKVVSAP